MKKLVSTQLLAVFGTILVLLPFLGVFVTSFYRLLRIGKLNLDYLAPAEFFIVVLVGAILLIWAAAWAKKRLAQVLWTFGTALGLLILSQGIAVWTGLASGQTPGSGWQMILVSGMLIAYDLAILALGILGVLLVRDVRDQQPPIS